MAYIFLDESGDLGFDFTKLKTSNYFVVAALFTQHPRPIEKCVRKVFSGLRQKYQMKGVLHAHKEESVTRRRLLHCIVDKDCYVVCIVVNKRRVYAHLQNEKNVLYNYVVNILLDRILRDNPFPDETVHVVAAQKETNKYLNQNFKSYLLEKQENISVSVATTVQEKCLQAVDCISWTIFGDHEKGNSSYRRIIEGIIREEVFLYGRE